MAKELISMRAYARINGCDDKMIRLAVKTGEISKGYDKASKKIDVSAADIEWGFKYRARKANELLKAVSTKDLEGVGNIDIQEIQLNVDDPQIVIERKHAYIKAHRDLLKLKTEARELVNREEVDNELFNFGKEIRLAFQALPDRIIDQLISLERHKAHKMLTESINEVLTKLTEQGNGI